MDEWITPAIGVIGTLAGTGFGYLGALRISGRDQRNALRMQIRNALADYLGALYASVAELRDIPPAKPPSFLDRGVDAIRGEQGAWVARRRSEFRLTGDRYRELAGRQAAAAARLQVLPLPTELRVAFDAANDYVERLSEQRTPELKREWSEIRAQLMQAAKALDPPRRFRFDALGVLSRSGLKFPDSHPEKVES